ncbi:MAG: DUF4291 domain-containing protein [Saccharospirillaceae bacterium]|nr:DUF4291 domain-containing protein [Pseudomonadales bacterium]NRB79619.1 DUF4291 domain-containing protein [Saccharospirillaceae bacterium]
MNIPEREIRANFNDNNIRVYQAYNDVIADTAIKKGTFVSPPFKMERMTWIKPSFLWMMYRSGWGKKDVGQNRILAIDISREGFEWALQNSLLSHEANNYQDKTQWNKMKETTPVRIQWDPERNFSFEALKNRSIQIGLTKNAVKLYVNEWIQNITDVTELAGKIQELVNDGKLDEAQKLLPIEDVYPLTEQQITKLHATPIL